jgi:hypothetical protein
VGPGAGSDSCGKSLAENLLRKISCGKSHHHWEFNNNKHLKLHNRPENSSLPTEINLLSAIQNRLLQECFDAVRYLEPAMLTMCLCV